MAHTSKCYGPHTRQSGLGEWYPAHMTTAQKLMTADEFEDKYLGKGPGKSELWYGEVKTMAPPGYEHGRNASRIDRLLGYFAESRKLGDVLTFWVQEGKFGFSPTLSAEPMKVIKPDSMPTE